MKTVHILRAGLALCGFSDKIPMYWPIEHVWVHPTEVPTPRSLEGTKTRLCERCLELSRDA